MLDDLLDEEHEGKAEVFDETLLVPRDTSLCLGHDAIEANLLELFQKNKLPHALAFCGPRGIGKATFAYRLIRFLFHEQLSGAQGGAGLFGDEPLPPENMSIPTDSDAFAKVSSGGLSDLKIIEREFDETKGRYKGNIGIDLIRKITPFLFSTAAYGGWRVILIDDADTMNRNAQNALLKNLEEPPKNCLIILICHQMGKMLPTIKSRVRSYTFQPLSAPYMAKILDLMPSDMSAQDKEFISIISAGSAGVAKEFIEDGGLSVAHKVMACFENEHGYRMNAYDMANAFSGRGADQSLQSFKVFTSWLVHHLTKLKASNVSDLSEFTSLKLLNGFYIQKSLDELIEVMDALASHFNQCDKGNLDRHYTVYHAMELLK